MRSLFTFGRLCLRQSRVRIRPPASQQPRIYRTITNRFAGAKSQFHKSRSDGFKIICSVAVLSPALFMQLSEQDNDGTDNTAEARMLEASRDEIEKKLSDDDHGLSRFYHSIVLLVDLYVWEPLCTGIRFVHLVLIFVPVIVTVPVMWLGGRRPKQDNERTGTLWWYRFLVKSMERAGPAFIKVPRLIPFTQAMLTSPSLVNGLPPAPISSQLKCAK